MFQLQVAKVPEWPNHSFSELKLKNNIWLYGAGNLAILLKDLLKEKCNRVPRGVADTYSTGEWNGYFLITPDELMKKVEPGDVILISSSLWVEIRQMLLEMKVTCPVYGYLTEGRDIIYRLL